MKKKTYRIEKNQFDTYFLEQGQTSSLQKNKKTK